MTRTPSVQCHRPFQSQVATTLVGSRTLCLGCGLYVEDICQREVESAIPWSLKGAAVVTVALVFLLFFGFKLLVPTARPHGNITVFLQERFKYFDTRDWDENDLA